MWLLLSSFKMTYAWGKSSGKPCLLLPRRISRRSSTFHPKPAAKKSTGTRKQQRMIPRKATISGGVFRHSGAEKGAANDPCRLDQRQCNRDHPRNRDHPASAATRTEEDADDDRNSKKDTDVGLAHSQEERDAAADAKIQKARSGARRKVDEPCTKTAHLVDRTSNRLCQAAHMAAARASDTMHFADQPKGTPSRDFLGIEVNQVAPLEAHGGGTIPSRLHRKKTVVIFSGQSDRGEIQRILMEAAKAAKHADPQKNSTHERVFLGRVRGAFGTAADAVTSFFQRIANSRKQPSKTPVSGDDIIDQQLAETDDSEGEPDSP